MRKLTARAAVALVATVVLTGACGTRTEKPSADAAATATTAGGAARDAGGSATGATMGSDGGVTQPGAATGTATGRGGPSTGAGGPAAGSTSSPATASGKPGSGAAPSAGSSAGQATSQTGSGSGSQTSPAQGAAAGPARPTPGAPGTPAPTPATPAAPSGHSPINLGSVGILSGPAGGALAPNVAGTQVWVKYINAQGGLNGHPVKYFAYDDGGDPARHRAQVQDAIEQKHVIAFVMNNEAIAGKSSVDYITAKRVPVIGNEGASYWFYDSPMYFVQASTGDANFFAAIGAGAQLLLDKGKKYGSIVCVEADGCNAAARVTSQSAKDVGFDVVYTARASIAQPDYTAECLAARNAGVETFLVFLDPAGIGRVGTACARQGFKPHYLTANSLVVDAQKNDPNLAGIVASTPVFPWFQTGTPATDEYQAAYQQFGGGLAPGVGGPTGWTSAKVFEKAAANIGEPPTSEAVLKGLWTFRNETLGGITQPLTFFEGKNATPLSCWFTIVATKGAWTSPDNYTTHCKA